MADSAENKPKSQADQIPPETSLVLVKNKDGSLTEKLRSAKGTFVAKKKPLIPTIEFTRKERKILYSPCQQKDKEGMTEHEVAFRNILSIAQCESTDAKVMMAAVKAYEILTRRAFGKEAPSEQELDKLERQPITAYFVQAPALENPSIEDGDKVVEKPTLPSFAEVTAVTTNPKK